MRNNYEELGNDYKALLKVCACRSLVLTACLDYDTTSTPMQTKSDVATNAKSLRVSLR